MSIDIFLRLINIAAFGILFVMYFRTWKYINENSIDTDEFAEDLELFLLNKKENETYSSAIKKYFKQKYEDYDYE